MIHCSRCGLSAITTQSFGWVVTANGGWRCPECQRSFAPVREIEISHMRHQTSDVSRIYVECSRCHVEVSVEFSRSLSRLRSPSYQASMPDCVVQDLINYLNSLCWEQVSFGGRAVICEACASRICTERRRFEHHGRSEWTQHTESVLDDANAVMYRQIAASVAASIDRDVIDEIARSVFGSSEDRDASPSEIAQHVERRKASLSVDEANIVKIISSGVVDPGVMDEIYDVMFEAIMT